MRHGTYVGNGKKGAGPIKVKPSATKMVPAKVTSLGDIILSQHQPQNGANAAYVPPLITNINPSTTGDSMNCLK